MRMYLATPWLKKHSAPELKPFFDEINTLIKERDEIAGKVDAIIESIMGEHKKFAAYVLTIGADCDDEYLAEICQSMFQWLNEKGFLTDKQWKYLYGQILPKIKEHNPAIKDWKAGNGFCKGAA